MIKRRQERQRKYDHSSSSDKFNGHNHHQNWTVSLCMTLNRHIRVIKKTDRHLNS